MSVGESPRRAFETSFLAADLRRAAGDRIVGMRVELSDGDARAGDRGEQTARKVDLKTD
jgi:hypothetical protein